MSPPFRSSTLVEVNCPLVGQIERLASGHTVARTHPGKELTGATVLLTVRMSLVAPRLMIQS